MQCIRLLVVISVILAGAFLPSLSRAHMEDAPLLVDLIADGGSPATEIDVGDVFVWNDDEYLFIRIETADGWCATSTSLHVFLDDVEFLDVPLTKSGNPRVGKFDVKMDHACTTEYDVPPIPLGDWLVDTQLFIAVHADVQKMVEPDEFRYESAWAYGDGFPGRNWAMYFGYVVQTYCCTVTGYAQTACDINISPYYWVYSYDVSNCGTPGQLSATQVGCVSQSTYWSATIDDPTVEVVDNMAEISGPVTEKYGGAPSSFPQIGDPLSVKVWDNAPDVFQFRWFDDPYQEPALDYIDVAINCGVTLCPCFNAGMTEGVGIDFGYQLMSDAQCVDLLPDAIQLSGTRNSSGNDPMTDPYGWIANAAYASVTGLNQCWFTDTLYGIDNTTGYISDGEVNACLNILLNSQMFTENACPPQP